MPALPPPSMQIGALPPGFGPGAPSGPALGPGFVTTGPSLIQQVAGASSAAAPATFTLAGITATQPGSFLVCCAAAALSGAGSIANPTGAWAGVASASGGSGNAILGKMYILPNNGGGITSVVFSTLTAVNGIAVWFGEFANVLATDAVYGTSGAMQSYANSTGQTSTSYTPAAGPLLLVGFETDLTGQTYTPGLVGKNWVTGTPATSTLGATNVVIRPFFVFTNPELLQAYQIAGTLAGALVNGVSQLSLLTSTSGPLQQPQPFGFPGGASGAAWGALGGTKPGGAGGGN